MIEIKLKDLNDFVVSANLDGTVFRLYFSWNTAGEYWAIGIFDANDTVIIEKIKIVEQYPLMLQYKDERYPLGEFIVIGDRPTRDSFVNSKNKLIYVTRAELLS